jgi:hypothetical protein
MAGNAGSSRTELQNTVTEETISERRLWTAVIVNAVEDWRGGTLRARREAQEFLFDSDQDFEMVCAGAGLNAAGFRAKLLRLGCLIRMEGPFALGLAELGSHS